MTDTPQLDNGFTRIADEILENLMKINLSSYQTRILFFIFRKTYGYGKKEDWISVSQIAEATGIKKSHVSRTKSELLTRKIVTSNGNKIAFQKDARLWCELPSKVTVTKPGQKLPNEGNTIDNIQKTYLLSKDNKDKVRDEVVDFVIEQFRNRYGFSPIDKKPRYVAYHISQITKTFIKNYGAIYEVKKGEKAEVKTIIARVFDKFMQEDYAKDTQYLDTFKRHLRKILEITGAKLINNSSKIQ